MSESLPSFDAVAFLGFALMAAALIDRLLHHCHIINIRGNSYRMRHHTELWRSLNDGDSASASSPKRRTPRSKEKETT